MEQTSGSTGTVGASDRIDDFVDTLSAFPNGQHDDDVDALTQLLKQWRKANQEGGFLQYARQVVAEAVANGWRNPYE